MKFFLTLFIGAVLVVAIVQVADLYRQRTSLAQEVNSLESKAEKLEQERRALEQDIQYYEEDRNLGKEFKSKFNYKDPNETMVILVPGQSE